MASESNLYASTITLTGTSYSNATTGLNGITASGTNVLFGDGTNTDPNGSTVTFTGTVFGFPYSEPGQFIGTATDSNGNFVGFIVYSPALGGFVGTNYLLITKAPLTSTTGTLHISTGANDPTKSDNWSLQNDKAVCFAEGTLIATPDGERAVETLRAGGMVATHQGPKEIIWVGSRSVDLAKMPDPEEHYLVRIRTGAFDDATPRRDLLVTQEHCVFVEGNLIPARMLVNGGSIIIDRSITAFSYYHVELARHGILFAEGLATESYLDTGNRARFANSEIATIQPDASLNASHKNWQIHAAAPLAVARDVVEPVWQRLAARARDTGNLTASPQNQTTHDAGLYLTTATGAQIQPIRNTDGRYVFVIPAGSAGLRLVSRAAKPSDMVGPFVDDRRSLGVEVAGITAWHGRQRVEINTHLAARELPGWFGMDNPNRRWTNGNAALPLPLTDRAVVLEMEIVAAGPYPLDAVARDLSSAKAA